MAEVSIDGAVTKSPWHPTTIYRPRGKKLGAPWLLVAPPQSLASTLAHRAQKEGGHLERLTEGQAPRGRRASEHGI